MTGLIIIGGGEHARVVIDAARAAGGFTLVGFADPRPQPQTEALGLPRIASETAALRLAAGHAFLVAVGPKPGSTARTELIERYRAAGVRFAVVVHPSAVVAESARLEPGVVVLANAVVNPGAHIGEHAVVNSGAVVEHDVVIGAEVHVAPAAAIGGGAVIGERSYLGLGCRVRDHVTLGPDTVVAMGAVVVRSHGPGRRLAGVPAKETAHV